MKATFRAIVLIAAILTILDKTKQGASWLVIRLYKWAEKSLDAEFGLWWMSGPSETVQRSIRDNTGMLGMEAQKMEESVRRAAVILALFANWSTKYPKRGGISAEILDAVFIGIDQGVDIARRHVADFGLEPDEIEAYFTYTQ